MAKIITFTAPPSSIADLVATLQSGGALTASTTYYYVVLACVGGSWYGVDTKISGISNEVSATTDVTNKTIRLDWAAITGASGYLVFRSTISGDYTGSKRFNKETNNDTWGYTTVNNYYVDAGAATPTMGSSYMLSVIPISKAMPMGLDPRTHGIGDLTLEGGTSGDPITLQNIYDAAVSGGWSNWCKWDNGNFGLMANFRSTAVETHFADTFGSTIYTLGWFNLNYSVVPASEFIFGQSINNSGFYPTKIVHLAGRGAEFSIQLGVKFYGTIIVGCANYLSPYYVAGINAAQFIYALNATFQDVSISGFSYFYVFNVSSEPFIKNMKTHMTMLAHTGSPVLIQGIEVNNINGQSSNISRLDGFISLGVSSSHIQQSTTGVSYYIILIDPYTPNIYEVNNLPTIQWYASIYTDYCDVYRSLIVRVLTEDGSPLAGVSLKIINASGAVANDFNGTSFENIISDAQGYFWIEKITVTGSSVTTITDSSKNWTVNQWKGRNLWIINGTQKGKLIKIKSNTASQITLCESLTVAPAVGDLVGIKMEIKQARLTHKAGTGGGYGVNYTTTGLYTPHTIIISKSGYKTYRSKMTIDKKIDATITLSKIKDLNFSKHIKAKIQ
jgi:hypothetical protein